MGGATNCVSLGDIWKSRDGQNWELVTDHAPWGLSDSGNIIAAKGRLYFIKEGTRWDTSLGIISAPIQIWSTTDGLTWQRESGQAGNVIISAYSEEDLGKIDRGIETKDTLYFFDGPQYELFFRDHHRDIAQRTFGLRGLDHGTIAELRMNGQRPIFIVQRAHTIYSSFDLHQWDEYSLETQKEDDGEQYNSGFLSQNDDDIKYKPFIFKNKLFMVGVDFGESKVYSAELVVDSKKELIRQVHSNHSSKAKKRERKLSVPESPDLQVLDQDIPEDEEKVDADTFRLKVVEHLSWDAYHGSKKGFLLGDKNNKPIVGMTFNIKLPDGSILERKTDASGVIEINGVKKVGFCEVSYSPEVSKYYNAIFYERTNAIRPQKVSPTGQRLLWKKNGLLPGKTHLFSVQ
jgi:hypothetical protein